MYNEILYPQDRYMSNRPYDTPSYYDDILTEDTNDIDECLHVLAEAGGINFAKPQKRKARLITDKNELESILSIDHTKASQKSTIMDLFGDFGDGPKYNPYDIITVPPRAYGGLSKIDKEVACTSSTKTNSTKFVTTIGLWIFNRWFIEPMSDILGYINESITADVYGSINKKVSYALLEDKITVKQLKNFIIDSQIIMSCCSAIASSHTETMFTMEELIAKKKKELLKKYEKGIKEVDLTVMKALEAELIDYAKEILKDDPAKDMFDSGARSSYGNNFKNMYLLRSGIRKTDGTYAIVTTSYIEGMDAKDYADINDAAVGGPFSRSNKTREGGYIERLVLGSTAHIKILGKDSDCGTKEYITVDLTSKNVSDWYYSFMVANNGAVVELTPENAEKYIGKTVKMRYSSLCKAKNSCICEHCAGTLFRRIGIINAGMASPIMASSMKNTAMKAFHDSTIKLTKVDPNEVFGLK